MKWLALISILLFFGCTLAPVESEESPKKSYGDQTVATLKSPQFWAPMAGAGVIYLFDWNEKISDWALDAKPIYGSVQNADDKSDDFDHFLRQEMRLSVFFSPYGASSDSLWQYLVAKVYQFEMGDFSFRTSKRFTNFLKREIPSERPNGSDQKDFPSGHSSRAGSASSIADRNFGASSLSPGWKRGIMIFNGVLSAGVLWGRIESGNHYASSALAGYSFGFLTTSLVYDLLMRFDINKTFAFFWNGQDETFVEYRLAF